MKICEEYDANGFTEGLSLIIGFPWTSEDDKKYETVSLRGILREVPGFASLEQTVRDMAPDVSLSFLQKSLRAINVVVVPGAASWPKYKSSQAISMTLLALLESLIKQESGYKRDDETSTKKLRRKLTDIAG